MRRVLAVLIATVALSACYHATIETGPAPAGSAQVIDIPWAHGFIYGLVPPSMVDAKAKCTNGVAKVETELSFMNGLVGALTGSLYTPMHIKVTCR